MLARSLLRSLARSITSVAIPAAALALTSCASSHEVPVEPLVPGAHAEALIGAAGGRLEVGDLVLEIPAGALASDTMIGATVTEAAVPGTFQGYSPVVHFTPEDLTFGAPIEVRIPYEGDPTLATVFWSQHEGEAYVARRTRIEGGWAITSSTHFSSAFVGTACEGEGCCDAGNGELDLLLVVDNSGSMAEEQALLATEIPRLSRILASGDRDGDGVQDFPALASVHVGVITTDLGTSSPADVFVPSCDVGYGDDGVLRTTGDGLGCEASYPNVATYDESDPESLDAFVSQIGCVASVGTIGCGFEQQLEATLIALSPRAPTGYTGPGYVPPSFLGGRPSHGDAANAGLVRDESILAVLELTDESDTSTTDPALFQLESPAYVGTSLNVRGAMFPEVLQPTARYVEGLLALRTDPSDVVFGAVAGVPVESVPDPANVDFDAVLGDPAMVETLDPTSPERILPSCTSERGTAFPANRIVRVARGIDEAGGRTVIGSICESSFDRVIDGLIAQIAARAAGHCE